MATRPRRSPRELETLILDAAAKCIEQTSLLDFSMAAIAKEVGASMGSIYKHVQSKEDVLVALATRVASNQNQAFAEMMALPISTPERLICPLLASPDKLHALSFGVHLEMLIGNEAVAQRASVHWSEKLTRINQSTELVFSDALSAACDDGELIVSVQDRERTIEMLSISLWSLCVGFIQAAYQRHVWNVSGTGTDLPFPLPIDHEVVESAVRLINAFDWREPLRLERLEEVSGILIERGYR